VKFDVVGDGLVDAIAARAILGGGKGIKCLAFSESV
jgi:hypothetical protein